MKREDIKNLLQKKLQTVTTPHDLEKCQVIQELLKEENCFFQMKMETAIGIFEFLGLAPEESVTLYYQLIAPENYRQNQPKQRYIMNEELPNPISKGI